MHGRDAIVVGTLTVTAVLLGNGTSWLLAGALPVPAAPPIVAHESAGQASSPTSPCSLIERAGFFDSSLHPTCEATPGPVEPTAPRDEMDSDAPCPSTLRLVGAVVPTASEPFAAIAEGSGAAMLYAVGMEVGDHEVRVIRRDEVVLATEGGACRLTMFEHEAPRALASDSRPSPPLASHATGPGSFRVARAEIDRTMGELMATLRALPHVDAQGAVDGYRIVGVRGDGAAAALGIENGDVITAVDERPLTDVSAAVDALALLRTARHATLHVIRRGQPLAIAYELD